MSAAGSSLWLPSLAISFEVLLGPPDFGRLVGREMPHVWAGWVCGVPSAPRGILRCEFPADEQSPDLVLGQRQVSRLSQLPVEGCQEEGVHLKG